MLHSTEVRISVPMSCFRLLAPHLLSDDFASCFSDFPAVLYLDIRLTKRSYAVYLLQRCP